MRSAVCIGLVLALLASAAARAADYEVTWRPGATPRAEVRAVLHSADCRFRTSDHWADFFQGDRGWSQFMTLGPVTDTRGRRLAARPVANGWTLDTPGPCVATVRYAVDFAFGRKAWEPGNEQVAYATTDAVYTTGLPLFLLGDDGPATVSMKLPAGWSAVTPWEPAGGGRYRVVDQKRLLENTLVVGRVASATFKAPDLDVSMALLGDMAASQDLLQGAFRKVVARFGELFHETSSSRYMFVVLPGPDDGESFMDSFAVTTGHPPVEANRIVWANHLAHELLHYWMGGKIAPSDADADRMQWFTEGFTEYLADRTLLDTRVLSDRDFLALMARRLGTYVMTRQNPNFAEVTLSAAGAHKWRNRPVVYDAGATAAFCLDGRIRTLTAGRAGLGDVIGMIYADSRAGKPLTFEGVVKASSAVAGRDMSSFFADYVDGPKALDIEACARDQGMEALVHNFDVFVRRPGGPVQ